MNDKIDDTFAGVTASSEIIPMGRPDETDRPGAALVEMVAEHRAAGGFRNDAQREAPAETVLTTIEPVKGLSANYTAAGDEKEHDLKE